MLNKIGRGLGFRIENSPGAGRRLIYWALATD